MTEIDIKNKRKESIRNEHFLFRLLIKLGAVRYNMNYDKFHGYRKTYKVKIWHPLVWIILIPIIICAIPRMVFNVLYDLKEEFEEKTYYC